jgi:hypothetical protein
MKGTLIDRRALGRTAVLALTLLIVVGALAPMAVGASKTKRRDSAKAGEARTRELFGIRWHASFDAACRAAQGKTPGDVGKPVMHLRVLGDPAGYM